MLLERITLEKDERVLKLVRKHWWVLAVGLSTTLLFALAPLLLWWLFSLFEQPLTTTIFEHSAALTYGYALWLLVLWMGLGSFWTDYYLDLWAITNRRVILIDQRGFFRRFISSFRLERLQDMNIEINGIIPTLLDFGTIEAQTAGGSNERFESHDMPHPRDIKALIVNTADALVTEQSERIATLRSQGL